MSYDQKLAERVNDILAQSKRKIAEKKMFGGLCFMVDDKMCVGVEKERLMVRLDPSSYEKALEKEGCYPMDFTGKVMKGFVFVNKDVLKTKPQLNFWLKLALDYNKVVPVRKKKKKVAANKGK